MGLQETIRNKLAAKVLNLNTIGKSLTLKSKSAPVYNDRGELENGTVTESTIVGVPYNITNQDKNSAEFGIMLEGVMEVAISWDIVINVDDALTIESEDWLVTNVGKNYLPDNVVNIVRVVRQQL